MGKSCSRSVRQLVTSQPYSGSREECCCSVHSLHCIQSRTPAIDGCHPLFLVGPSLLQLTWSRSSSHFLGDSSVVCLPGNHIRLAFKIAHWPEVHQFGLGWPARSPKDPLVLVTPALDSKCTPPHLSVSAHACEYMHTHAYAHTYACVSRHMLLCASRGQRRTLGVSPYLHLV